MKNKSRIIGYLYIVFTLVSYGVVLSLWAYTFFKDGISYSEIFLLVFSIIIYISFIVIYFDITEYLKYKNKVIKDKYFQLHLLFKEMDDYKRYSKCAESYINKKYEKLVYEAKKQLYCNNELKYLKNKINDINDLEEINDVISSSEASQMTKRVIKGYLKASKKYSIEQFEECYKSYLRGDFIKKIKFPIKEIFVSLISCMVSILVMFYQLIKEMGNPDELKPIMTYLGLYSLICLMGLVQGVGKYFDIRFEEPARIDEMILILKDGVYDNNDSI